MGPFHDASTLHSLRFPRKWNRSKNFRDPRNRPGSGPSHQWHRERLLGGAHWDGTLSGGPSESSTAAAGFGKPWGRDRFPPIRVGMTGSGGVGHPARVEQVIAGGRHLPDEGQRTVRAAWGAARNASEKDRFWGEPVLCCLARRHAGAQVDRICSGCRDWRWVGHHRGAETRHPTARLGRCIQPLPSSRSTS